MKKFALSLLIVSNLTLTTLHAAQAGNKRIHHRGNPQAAVLDAIAKAEIDNVRDMLRDKEGTRELLDHAITKFSPKKEDCAKILSLIAKKSSAPIIAAVRSELERKQREKATTPAEKSKIETMLVLISKASRRSSSSLSE